MWPRSFREQSRRYFEYQPVARAQLLRPNNVAPIGTLHRVLSETGLETLPLWLLGSDADKQRIAARIGERGQRKMQADYERALDALARRDYATAAKLLQAVPDNPTFPMRTAYRLYALCMAGQIDAARREAGALEMSMSGDWTPDYWAFMKQSFGLEPRLPSSLPSW
jgi:hypothetical protein